MAHSKSRTGVLEGAGMHPSTSRIGMKSSNKSGTGTQISTKKMIQESSVLKEDQLLLKLDSLLSGTNLMSDLNTPEIKPDDFEFKAWSYHNGNDFEVGGSSAVASPASHLSSNEDDSTSVCAPATGDDKYTLIDMSPGMPGSRDLLQADHYEQRIDLEKLTPSVNGTVPYSIVMDPIHELDSGLLEVSLPMENFIGNGLEAQPLAQPAQSMDMPPVDSFVTTAEDSGFPQLSLDDESLFPKEILDQIDSLFPEENFSLKDEMPSGSINSQDLDMYLGRTTMPTDIVSESLEQAGLHAELESMDFLDEGGLAVAANALDQFDSMRDDAAISQLTNFLHQSAAVNILPTHLISNGTRVSNFSTPSTSKSNVTVQLLECIQPDIASTPNLVQPTLTTPSVFTTPSSSTVNLKAPSKKRKPELDVTPSTSTGKRQRRTAKKPLRFREPETVLEFTDLECIDGVTQTFDRIGYDVTDALVKQEEEIDETTSITTLRRGRNADQILTEEQKYHRIRVLNNEASKRCRQKRKQTIKETEVELTSLERRNAELKVKHEKLQNLRDKVKAIVYDSLRKK